MADCWGRRDLETHRAQMAEHGIAPIDLLVCNLYPFEATVASGAGEAECVENIDIGGPALIRAAAKNHTHVAVVTEPGQYAALIEALASGGTRLALRRRWAAAAYARTAAYDSAIAGWFAGRLGEAFPRAVQRGGDAAADAAVRREPASAGGACIVAGDRPGVARAEQVQGKELSFNNLNDTDAALECVAEFGAPTIVIVKHANPCGVASGADLAAAWEAALRCDPVSAFGGIVAANRVLDGAAAERIAAIFTEVIVAPDADAEARAVLARKKGLRLLLTGAMPDPGAPGVQVRSIAGGLLVQERDAGRVSDADLRVVTRRAPTEAERADLLFRVPGVQAREVERDRLRAGGCHGGRRRRADEPGRFGADRGVEGPGRGGSGGVGREPDGGQRRGVGRVLPVRGRAGGGDRGGCDGGDPARRVDPGSGSNRSGRQGGDRDGLYWDAAFSTLRGIRKFEF